MANRRKSKNTLEFLKELRDKVNNKTNSKKTIKFDFNSTLGDESDLLCKGGCGQTKEACLCKKIDESIK